MTVEPIPQSPGTFGELGFDAFYGRNLPIVYGYALRLCGGSVDGAQDLAQEAWLQFVDRVRDGRAENLDVRWLIAVARNRYVDQWRRGRRLESKLGLVWNTSRDADCDGSVTREQVRDRLMDLTDEHRVVLALRYVDVLPVENNFFRLYACTRRRPVPPHPIPPPRRRRRSDWSRARRRRTRACPRRAC